MSQIFRSFELAINNAFGTSILAVPHNRITSIANLSLQSQGELAHTVIGIPTLRGVRHEPRFLWEIEFFLDENNYNLLRGIQKRQDDKRRQFVEPAVTFVDKIQKYTEDPPRSRGIAPGTTETTTADGRIEYYATYKVYISDLSATHIGRFYQVSMTLLETEPTPV